MQSKYLKSQIITYMGNKRKLLTQIDDIIDMVKKELDQSTFETADAFSGSGIVSRLLKTRSTKLYVNDIAGYAETLNCCFLDTEFLSLVNVSCLGLPIGKILSSLIL